VGSEEVVYLLFLRRRLLREGWMRQDEQKREKDDGRRCEMRLDPGRLHNDYDNSFGAKKLRPVEDRPQ
jgi:hypothetical protein